jgi:SAM-dependent methyltransferase
VTDAEIILAYRLLFGRDPADDGELAPYRGADSVAELRQRMMSAPAFASALPMPAVQLPLSAPPLDIEVAVDDETARMLLERVAESWGLLGRDRPHWSVKTQDAFRPEHIGENLPLFEATGAEKLGELLGCLARHSFAADRFSKVCDFGCGVGRVTMPMAEHFAHVVACDVSTSHLDVARLASAQRGLRNIHYSLVTPRDFGMFAPFDLWFSQAVLQHNAPPVSALILRRMFEMLAPGGVAVFQVPTYLRGYRFRAAAYFADVPPAGGMELHVLPQEAVFALAARAGCVPLEVWSDATIWPPALCTSSVFMFTKPV